VKHDEAGKVLGGEHLEPRELATRMSTLIWTEKERVHAHRNSVRCVEASSDNKRFSQIQRYSRTTANVVKTRKGAFGRVRVELAANCLHQSTSTNARFVCREQERAHEAHLLKDVEGLE